MAKNKITLIIQKALCSVRNSTVKKLLASVDLCHFYYLIYSAPRHCKQAITDLNLTLSLMQQAESRRVL
jgi:hypothetical protein